MKSFIDNLIEKIQEKKSHVVVGLDPDYELMPKYIVNKTKMLDDVTETIFEFNSSIIDSVCDLVPAIKPQIAFFERYGIAGIKAFEKTVNYGKQKGLIVIEDAKRNDIGSTAMAYSEGHLGKVEIDGQKISVFDVDAITVNPYLGSDSIDPFLHDVQKYQKGIFVLVKTSNQSSIEIQDTKIINDNGEKYKLYELIAKLVDKWGKPLIGNSGYSSVGAVVGATFPKDAEILRKLMPNNYFLVPGYGAQGGSARDVINCFNKDGYGALISASRSINYAYMSSTKHGDKDFSKATREAVIKMNSEINQLLKYKFNSKI